MDENDPNYNGSGMGFSDKTIRAGFIRRVYSILSVRIDIENLIFFSHSNMRDLSKQTVEKCLTSSTWRGRGESNLFSIDRQ
jgi:hypothetical protein